MSLAEDERDYAEATAELRAGVLREGLWAKCIAETMGQVEPAKALYLRYRVELIRNERKQDEKRIAREAAERENAAAELRKEALRREIQAAEAENKKWMEEHPLQTLLLGAVIVVVLGFLLLKTLSRL